MRIAIASGKGGTGKTIVSVNFAATLASCGHKVQYLDCDVEEPNGHIFLKPQITAVEQVYLSVPVLDSAKCNGCRKCAEVCRYNAIAMLDTPLFFNELCHGCGGCTLVCPTGAISEQPHTIGVVENGTAGNIKFTQGRLNVGAPISPPVIRQTLSKCEDGYINVIDAPPGTACGALTTVRGAAFVVLVTEPTPFGLHDLKLAVEMVANLGVPYGVVINRCDAGDDRVVRYCQEQQIPILLELPEDHRVARMYSRGEMIFDELTAWREAMLKLSECVGCQSKN